MSPTSPPEASHRSGVDVARALLLVGALMAWNQASDRISEHFGRDALPLASFGRLSGIVVGVAITCGVIVGLGCVRWGKRSLRTLGWSGAGPARLLGAGLGLTAVVVGLVFGAYAAMAGTAGVRGLATAIVTLPLGDRLFFLVMGAKVAFVEETLFRGDLLQALRPRVGAAAAIALSSVVFALFHRTLSPLPLVMKLAFGALFAASAVRFRSLWPGAIAHTLMGAIVADN